MARSEPEFIDWLAGRLRSDAAHVVLGIGDDMSIAQVGGEAILATSDMLADGVHFDTRTQPLADIGHKCIACSLSDCAAMAVRPLTATVSAVLPRGMDQANVRALVDGMARTANEFDCPITGGDTVVWAGPLVVDVSINAVPYPGIDPVRRSTAVAGDGIHVTGTLGGSSLGKHLTFIPRVAEARAIAETLGSDLHAMMDLSDGLSLDLFRMCQASDVGATLTAALLDRVTSTDARRVAERDGRTPTDHALNDGEDFELLLAVDGERPAEELAGLGLFRVGTVTERGLVLELPNGNHSPLHPGGYQHRL